MNTLNTQCVSSLEGSFRSYIFPVEAHVASFAVAGSSGQAGHPWQAAVDAVGCPFCLICLYSKPNYHSGYDLNDLNDDNDVTKDMQTLVHLVHQNHQKHNDRTTCFGMPKMSKFIKLPNNLLHSLRSHLFSCKQCFPGLTCQIIQIIQI